MAVTVGFSGVGVSVGVNVAVGSAVSVGVDVRVGEGVIVAVGVDVAVGLGVGVGEGKNERVLHAKEGITINTRGTTKIFRISASLCE